jgi:dihydroorotase
VREDIKQQATGNSGGTAALIIRGGRVIDPADGVDAIADVVIENGRIAFVGDAAGREGEAFDARGMVVAPGFVDIHTHLREPGQEYKETIASGAAAAAHGGFTTVCAMPNTVPPIDNRSVVEFVERQARGAPLRVLVIGCVTRGRAGKELAEMGELADAGCIGFSDDGSPVADPGVMRRALEYASAFGLPIINHCEEPSLANGGVMHEGWVATRLGLRGQPAAAEEAMVARDIQLAELTGAHVHLTHLSTAGSVELIRAAKRRGLPVTADVTPHHLTLTHEAVLTGPLGAADFALSLGPYDTNAKVHPPLRTPADVRACVEGLRDGTLDAVATDHAPHAATDKLCEFDLAAPGLTGLETALGLVLRVVGQGGVSLADAIARLTIGPVRALSLDRHTGEPALGTLRPGAPADLVVFNPATAWIVAPDVLRSKGKNTPLLGTELRGLVMLTVAGGVVSYAAPSLGPFPASAGPAAFNAGGGEARSAMVELGSPSPSIGGGGGGRGLDAARTSHPC